MDNRTVELVKTAENRQYTKFEEVAKEILKDKVKQSQAFQEFKEKMETIHECSGKKIAEAPDDEDIDADDEDGDSIPDKDDKKDKDDKDKED
jgi:rRNA maturation endonuclease Nob1